MRIIAHTRPLRGRFAMPRRQHHECSRASHDGSRNAAASTGRKRYAGSPAVGRHRPRMRTIQ